MDLKRSYIILLLEDDESDVFLMKRQLERNLEQVDLKVASTQEDYESLVKSANPDIILSDYRLPRYSGIEALLFARAHSPMVPFVFVTGALHNEELAADTILQGASGFVLKNNLDKLWTLLPKLLSPELTKAAHSKTLTQQAAKGDGKAKTETESKSDSKIDGIDSQDLVQAMSTANAETLAKIQRLLKGE